MIVDCDRCVVRGDACHDCVITLLLGSTPGDVELDAADQQALDVLAEAGMVPRLQLVRRDGITTREEGHTCAERTDRATNSVDERSSRDDERRNRHVS